MKNKYFFICMIFMSALMFSGCNEKNKIENDKENVELDLQKAQARFETEWVEFKKNAELKMQTNQTKIDSFKIIIKKAGKKVKSEYENRIVLMEQNNALLQKSLIEYKYEGKENWEKFKLQLNNKLDVVGKSIDDFFANK